jgi:ADP-heptose:LPS heptosyltransferase
MNIKTDCKNFIGDKPCVYHKETGVICDVCDKYLPIKERILIIKLDAVGDVLRTTSILPILKRQSPDSQITWITEQASLPLFINNPYVDRVFPVERAPLVLQTDIFNKIINLDASQTSSRIALMANGGIKIGFIYNHSLGATLPITPEAVDWFEMGLNDTLKKENKKTYQETMLEICKLPHNVVHEPILNLTEEEINNANRLSLVWGLKNRKVIGVNVGCGSRWEKKQWNRNKYSELINKLMAEGFKVLLFGGVQEAGLMRTILSSCKTGVINTGYDNSLRDFCSIINLCDLLVTGDTLGMHIATALKKKVVVLIGPTSSAELELYGRGAKVLGDVPCVGCYKQSCDVKPSCMDTIKVDVVFDCVKRNMLNV